MGAKADQRLIPTGVCWCGCGADVSIGAFFARGHDKVAEAALLAADYDASVARLLDRHGYGPGHAVVDAAVASGAWERCAARGCSYVGAPTSIRAHRQKVGH